jgi:hypothetical protein
MGAVAVVQAVVEEAQGAASIRVQSPVVLFRIQITLAMGIVMDLATTP